MPNADVIRFKCPLVNGLHARPATELTQICEPFEAEILITNLRNQHQASAFSILGLISADIRHNDSCEIKISGADAVSAHRRISKFINVELTHCDDSQAPTKDQASATIPRSLQSLTDQYVAGTIVSAGVGIGKPIVLSGPYFPAELLKLVVSDCGREWEKLTVAVSELSAKMQVSQQHAEGMEADVLRAHLAILQDSEFSKRLQSGLNRERPLSAAAALANTVAYFDQLLGATGNPYLQERALDIQDVCMQLLQLLYGDNAKPALPVLDQPCVIIATDLTPSDFIAIRNEFLQGLVLESGGKTSHTVILACAASIPTVVGAAGAVALAGADSGQIIVDANAGLLVPAKDQAVLKYYLNEQTKYHRINSRYQQYRVSKAITADGKRLEITANIALADEAAGVFSDGAEGIGLFRTEMLLMDCDQAPSEEQQFIAYKTAVEAAQGHPVVIRTFDIGGDKAISWLKLPKEENPFLGVRAVRLYPQIESLLITQYRALIRAAEFGDLRIMIPMIACVEELRWVRGIYDKVLHDWVESGNGSGVSPSKPKFGIMLEVPSAGMILDKLAVYCDFISIGSNDLAQYFLACDRGNTELSTLYSAYHPAFLRYLELVICNAKKAGLHTALCGEMAGDIEALPLFVALGIDEISMSAPKIARCKAELAGMDREACDQLFKHAMNAECVADVQQLLAGFSGNQQKKPLCEKQLIVFSEQAQNKHEAIKLLVDHAHLAGRCDDPNSLEEAIWQREDVFSTGLGFGIAIPHCKATAAKVNSLCIARFSTPLDWNSRDGEPVDTVILLMIRESESGNTHLKIFAQLARRIMHEDFRNQLRSCKDAGALLHFLDDILEVK